MIRRNRRSRLGALLGVASLGWLLTACTGALAAPEVGDAAPDFSLMGSDGRLHSLAEYRGRKAVVLAWFPKAFTPG
jgi:peroxiredoxin Q/BCP